MDTEKNTTTTTTLTPVEPYDPTEVEKMSQDTTPPPDEGDAKDD